MGPRKISFEAAQRHYDNLTPEDMYPRSKRRNYDVDDYDDYEYHDESYYKSKAFSRVMDAYERQIYGD